MSKIKAKNTLYNDPRYDVVVDSRMLEQHLKEKDQQIAELQKQLEEKEKEIKRFMSMKNREQLVVENEALKDTIAVVLAQKRTLYKSYDELKKQLKSQPAEIVEKIRKSIHYYPIALLDSDNELRIKTFGISKEVLDTILKEYQK